MHPFYFGTQEKLLFGIYHPPLTRADRDTGVVLCNPFGSEAIYAHRAFRQVAIRLSRVGFHVLRFDYYGCGDSAGEGNEGDVDQWKKDISLAIDELNNRAGVSRVSLVGLRLGATLGLLVAGERNDVESLVLWEPVVEGKAYIEELMTEQEGWMEKGEFSEAAITKLEDGTVEIIGFALTSQMRLGIESIDLLSLEKVTAKRLLIIRSPEKAGDQSLLKRLKELGASPNYSDLATPRVWLESQESDRIVVPNELLESIVLWLTRNHQ
jgi:exosortase A-associated hydrolase 2